MCHKSVIDIGTASAFVNAKVSLIAIENPISNDLFINRIIDNQLLCLKPIIHIGIIEVYEVYNVIRSIVLLNSIANNTNRSGSNQHDMYKSPVMQYVFSLLSSFGSINLSLEKI
jgi:hypothetical protein